MTNARQARQVGNAVADAAQGKRNARPDETDAPRVDRVKGRVPLGSGSNLAVPPHVQAHIQSLDMYPYWAIDDHRIDQFLAAGFEVYKDEEGQEYRRPTKDGNAKHILMIQPMEYHLEDLALQQGRTDANMLEAGEKLEEGQYIPDGKTFAVEKDRTQLPNR